MHLLRPTFTDLCPGPTLLAVVGDICSLPKKTLEGSDYRLSSATAAKTTLMRLVIAQPAPKGDKAAGENCEAALRRASFNRVARGGDLMQAVAFVQLARMMCRWGPTR
jgi:hypothetical protein